MKTNYFVILIFLVLSVAILSATFFYNDYTSVRIRHNGESVKLACKFDFDNETYELIYLGD